MLDLIKAIILGIVEGVTEFLPVSSTGHLIVVQALLQPGFSSVTFAIVIQLGAIIAVIAFYRADIWQQVRTVRTDRQVQHFWLAIVIAFIPAAIVGLALRHFIEDHLFNPLTVAITMIIGGVLIIAIERWFSGKSAQNDEALMDVSYRQALMIGLIQVLSLISGVSRAGTSIFGGMLSGLNRVTATRFSFYLAIPTLGGATVLDLLLNLKNMHGSDLIYLAVGTVTAGVVAWVTIGWLLRYISRNTYTIFGYYRIGGGILVLVLIAATLISAT